MAINNAHKQYKETQINTANQGKLIIMLYDGAIRFINNAIDCINKKKIEETHINITKARDIITELTTSLNMDAGEISQKLFSLYMYINNRLAQANMNKDTAPLEEVKKFLLDLRSAWAVASKDSTDSNLNKVETGGINIAT